MKTPLKSTWTFAVIVFSFLNINAQFSLPELLQDELNREMEVLAAHEIPVYYLAYRVVESERISTSAKFGYTTDTVRDQDRTLHISLRVGDHHFDNTRITGRDES